MTLKYVNHRTAVRVEGPTALARLSRRTSDCYVGIENRGEASWGVGEVAAIDVTSDCVTLNQAGRLRRFASNGSPLDALTQAFANVDVENWRAYGWVSFEFGLALHQPNIKVPGVLAHFVIPRAEVRTSKEGALIRAAAGDELKSLEASLIEPSCSELPPAHLIQADLNTGANEYRTSVAEAIEEIRVGRYDKVILSREVQVPEELDLVSTFLAGRSGNEPVRSFLLRLAGWEAAGFSPETVAEVGKDGWIRTQPLAGTRELVGDALVDDFRRQELGRDPKEVFEHAISVRVAVSELAEVCESSTVSVNEFMNVKRRGSVQHLGSNVSGRLAQGRTSWDAFGSLFPAVTASGIPKPEACAAVRRLETGPRGLYGGTILNVDADGSIDAALTLRSVFRNKGRTWLRAGAGVVAHSSPEREFDETNEKLRSVSRYLVAGRASSVSS